MSRYDTVGAEAPTVHDDHPPGTPAKAPRPRKPWPAALLITLSLTACAPPPPEVDMNMPAYIGPFLDTHFCESTGGGWLVDLYRGYTRYTLWQMEQLGVDDRGDIQMRYEIRGGELDCPVTFVTSVFPSFFRDGLSGNLASAWLWKVDGGGFQGPLEREYEIFMQQCYAERTDDYDCNEGSQFNALGVWETFSNDVQTPFPTNASFIVLNGKVFDSHTGQQIVSPERP